MAVAPLTHMKLRTAELPTALGASFGKVRNWSPQRMPLPSFIKDGTWRLQSGHLVAQSVTASSSTLALIRSLASRSYFGSRNPETDFNPSQATPSLRTTRTYPVFLSKPGKRFARGYNCIYRGERERFTDGTPS